MLQFDCCSPESPICFSLYGPRSRKLHLYLHLFTCKILFGPDRNSELYKVIGIISESENTNKFKSNGFAILFNLRKEKSNPFNFFFFAKFQMSAQAVTLIFSSLSLPLTALKQYCSFYVLVRTPKRTILFQCGQIKEEKNNASTSIKFHFCQKTENEVSVV